MKYSGFYCLLPGLLLLTLSAVVVKAQLAGRPQTQPLPGELRIPKTGADRAKVWLRLEEHQAFKPGESQVPGKAGDDLQPVRANQDKGGREAAVRKHKRPLTTTQETAPSTRREKPA